jgi:hypothetical protein
MLNLRRGVRKGRVVREIGEDEEKHTFYLPPR